MRLTNKFFIRGSIIVFCLFLIVTNDAFSQGYGKSSNPAYNDYYDSLMKMDYKFKLPYLGKQAYQRGYDLPYAFGGSLIYFTQRQEITIESTLIGFNDSELVDFSDLIEFGPTIATTNAYTFRPDIWLLPFLNVYAILGGGTTQTEVNLLSPIGLQTTQKFNVGSFGIGATLAGAIGPVWIAWDNNYNWADVEVVVEPVPAFNSSLRVGHSIMDATHPQRALSVWAGVFYQTIQNDTEGSIPLTDIFPNAGSGSTIGQLRDWAETLPPAQQIVANRIIDKIEDLSNGIDPGTAVINYKLDKKVTAPFNLILGAQYQFNKNWMLRSELGVFGKRSQFLLNLNYRFNWL